MGRPVNLFVCARVGTWREQEDRSGARPLSGVSHALWLCGLGAACGAAVSVKWTALATPAMVALESGLALFGCV